MTKITESGIFVKKYNIPDFFDRKENTAVLLSHYIRRSSAITENTAALVRIRTDTDRAGEPKKGRVHMEMKAMSTDRNLLLQLKGELDHHSARDVIREMELAIDAALPRNLVVDMEGITFMDSSGIAFILRAHRRMLNLNGGMLLCHVPRQAKRVLDAAGIGRLVRIQ